ncbi:MAG TPA: 16S rRNA (guanine(527)-N(7))-methyltransferase RsmG [Desulfosalsimonadaceae bacterium]|nr:16S rRNA (guanine(527)-N(7))-methyltransferase RsmG [Desulfosalsimonadaceae bacterium]
MKKPFKPRNTKGHTQADMAALIEGAGIFLSDAQLYQLWSYHTLLRRYNSELNLTRIHNFTNMVQKLYVDSILPGQMVKLPSPLLDIGTGPGMPGIPLKIAFPDLEIILAESRQHRAEFLETVIEALTLENISVVGRGITPKFEQPVAGVVTRAVESIEKTLARINGCLAEDGLAVFMKGPACDEEISAAGDRFNQFYALLINQSYQIPDTPHRRRLVVFRRIDAPKWEKEKRAMSKHVIRKIESEQNDTFKELKKLLTSRGIKKQERALVAGAKQVREIMRDFPDRCDAWLSEGSHQAPPEEAPDTLSWYQLSPKLFQELDVNGTQSPLLLVTTPRVGKWQRYDCFPEGCTLLVPFQDPENVGAVIRSAVAFGVKSIVLLAESAHPYHPKAVRASGGSVLYANLYQGPSILELPDDLPIIALSGEGKDIAECAFPEAFGLLPGVEGTGLPEHLRANSVAIPVSDAVESLNAATAAGIALYLWSRSGRK